MLTRITLLAALAAVVVNAQARRADARIDVEKYTIEARIDPEKQTLAAKVKMEFTPQDDAQEMTLGFHQALDLRSVTDGAGEVATSQRLPDSNIRVVFGQALPKGKRASLTFDYEGRLTGNEESPVWGIKFAAIHEDNAYLMYPARWFPVNDYTVDRFSMDLKVTVPAGFNVAASGLQLSANDVGGERVVEYEYAQTGFPGSFAVMKGEPKTVNSGGINGTFFFREGEKMADAYGQELGKAMEFFTGGRAERVFRAGCDFHVAGGHRDAGEQSRGGESGGAAVVGRAAVARLAQSFVDSEWSGPLRGVAVRGGSGRQGGVEHAGARDVCGGADGGATSDDSGGASGRLFAGVLGDYGGQGCGDAAHAARHHGR
jgi:hypothetical protein